MINFKKLKNSVFTLTVAIVALSAADAYANDMINNHASGFVGGDIFQVAPAESEVRLEVGSIAARRAEHNVAEGYVGGAVTQRGSSFSGPDPQNLVATVGSISAKNDATNNEARGYVAGEIIQDAYGVGSDIEARVGSIEAKDGSAFDNFAEGTVQGRIYQRAGDFAKVTARVGSIGPN